MMGKIKKKDKKITIKRIRIELETKNKLNKTFIFWQ
jgi:hypothetical protein